MPAPFKRLTLEQFADLVDRFHFTRKITTVHMHHTWRPNRSQFKGHETIVSMWNFHTQHNGWSDIAQHITIDPDGFIWLGRNWNAPPASASSQNGTQQAGPFMFEMIGDFDKGKDPFDGAQRETVIRVIALIQQRFGLAPTKLMFHNMMSGKTCPGSSIRYQDILTEVEQAHQEVLDRPRKSRSATFADDVLDDSSERIIEEAIEDLARVAASERDPEDAEACAHARSALSLDDGAAGLAPREAGLTPGQLAALRPHLINLAMGEFSDDGRWKTSRGDVDAIFDEHMERAFEHAQAHGMPMRIVIQAHGGLVNEAAGLAIAQKSVGWWLANGIYPLYFVWETGAFETIGQLLQRARQGTTRGLPRDAFFDPVTQEAVRVLQGPRIWGGMKLSAQLASASNILGDTGNKADAVPGAAVYVAEKLRDFCKKHKKTVELHAVGHSAGAIFLAHFLPRVLQFGAGPIQSVHLMAPAIRTDLFEATLARFLGPDAPGIKHLTMYTMRKDYEADDNCAGIYGKSLLYLIYHALEPQRKTPILGLEECVRANRQLAELFGLNGKSEYAEVVWSRTTPGTGRNASQSITHGGFDDDSATMGSIARRILARADADRIVEYQGARDGSRSADPWQAELELPAEIRLRPIPDGLAQLDGGGNGHDREERGAFPASGNGHAHAVVRSGRRRALCVGINRYPTAPLYGCLADVDAWTRTLGRLGFDDPVTLLNEHATRDAILAHLTQLVQTSRPGDVIVFQYSGHGTFVQDLDGDEADGDTPGQDEAICPVDFTSGALIIDDDIGRIFNLLPDGVNLTCFMDCCHSGTVSRFGVGKNAANTTHGNDERPRFIVASPELENAHRRYRAAQPASRTPMRGLARMREVVFSACLSSEVAWESGGQGEFTVRATRVLARAAASLTNAEFARLVVQEFGPAPRQQPRLYSSEQAEDLALLAPIQDLEQSAIGKPAQNGDALVLLQGMKKLLEQYGPL
ncbi:MAG: caspase family protein, partial [Telluria sp.]